MRAVMGPGLRSLALWAGLSGMALVGGCNPWAPALDDLRVDRQALLGDRRSVRGLFEYMRSTYELRDTALYGPLLDRQFTFAFRDFATGNDIIWDRDTEMRITTQMFSRIRSANLVWTWYVQADTATTDTLAQVERYFNLNVVVDEGQAYTGTGTARMTLVRPDRDAPWRVRHWMDIRDF